MSDEIPAALRAKADQASKAATDVAEAVTAAHLGFLIATHEGNETERALYATSAATPLMGAPHDVLFFTIQALGHLAARLVVQAHGDIDTLIANRDAGRCHCGEPIGHDHSNGLPPDPFTE